MPLRRSILTASLFCLTAAASAQPVQEQGRASSSDIDASLPVIAGVPDQAAATTLGELSWPMPISPFQMNPMMFLPAPAARAERVQVDPAQERQLRRFRVREVCNRESNTRLIQACFRCAERGEPYHWLERGNQDNAQRMYELMAVSGQSEGIFRCLDGRLRSTHRLIGELFRRDQTRQREMTTMRTDITQMQQAQGTIEPQLVARVMGVVLGALSRERLEREIEAQERRATDCDAGRLDVSVLNAADRERPEAPESMVLWSESEVRERGYRPRRAPSERPNCEEIRRSANAQREVLERQVRERWWPSATLAAQTQQLYQSQLASCAAGASPACAEAQARLSQLLSSTSVVVR